ncbi:hypothetical protein [Rhodomicrobium sp. Az07]|uniref:hypothetical protein n=1 Tax=Rhodomicrobium sp. Az07 TaxID=2839034 RepID=UPI0035304CCA
MTFLFAVWRKLVERLGPRAPRLVIVGHRGWENENVIDVLDRSSGLAPFLVEATDLSDAGLASLLSGAAALVSPSSVEGFGLKQLPRLMDQILHRPHDPAKPPFLLGQSRTNRRKFKWSALRI